MTTRTQQVQQQIQKQQPNNGAIQRQEPATLSDFIIKQKHHLEAALPKSKGLTVDRLIKLALLAANKQPALKNCEMPSVFQALMQCAELGLEPSGTLGHAYLVPYGKQCTLVIGYRGLIDLARRSGALKQIEAHVVHERDVFKLRFGLEPLLDHEPCLDGNPGRAKLVYCVVQLADGAKHVEVMTIAEIERIRDRSKARGGPWTTDFEEMAKKTVARRTCKWVPMSSELATALAHEEDGADQHGGVGLTVVQEAQPKTAAVREAVRVQQALPPKSPVIDVLPGETEEEAEARIASQVEPPPDVALPTDAAQGEA
jgi:recombination protein RecT